ncbi:MAG TPA: diaminopimelate epimerase [Mycobacteriales bacterium]|jgi:diaminopimelate epimerase|nr:diaminopimelate epimerase [Mycobacteriales bacterium]
MQFAKGHGTQNDFVLLPDIDGALTLTPALVRALCDRRAGIGADGVLRVVPTAKVDEVAHLAGQADWFMDYRNADGSVAEMCGNGVRVYARWLQEAGLAGDGVLPLATRDGLKAVTLAGDGDITVDMGPPQLPGRQRQVRAAGRTWSGLEVWMGNPHVVVEVGDPGEAGPLTEPPEVDFDTNVEFVSVRGPGQLVMRVHERGAGETRSCGTGACAAAVAVAVRSGHDQGSWAVEVPGGCLQVRWTGRTVLLTGPAVIVLEGTVDERWLAGIRPTADK